MTDTYRANLAPGSTGHWRLFVALPGRVADWPTHEFGTTAVPSRSARAEALASLGYQTTAPAGAVEWDWCEDAADYDNDDSAVILMASADVVPADRDRTAHDTDELPDYAPNPANPSTFQETLQRKRADHLAARQFTTGDRVELLVGQAYRKIDPDVADELEDREVRVRIPGGTTGEVVEVQQYVSPFPYVVQVRDNRGVTVELGIAEHDLARAAD